MKLRCDKCRAVIIIDDENLEPGKHEYVCPRCGEIIKFQVGEPAPAPAAAPTLNQRPDVPPPLQNAQRPREPQASDNGRQYAGMQDAASGDAYGGGMPRPPQKDGSKKGIGCFSVICILLVIMGGLGYCLYLIFGTDEYSTYFDRDPVQIDTDTVAVIEYPEEPQVNWDDSMFFDTIVEDSAYMAVPDTVYVRDTVYMREPEAEEVEPAYPVSSVRDDEPVDEINEMGFRNGVNKLTGDILHKGERYPCRISFKYDAKEDEIYDAEFVYMSSGTRVKFTNSSIYIYAHVIDFMGKDRGKVFIVRLEGTKKFSGYVWWGDSHEKLELRLDN